MTATTSAQIQTAWETYVWEKEDMHDITSKVYAYPILNMSEFEANKLYEDEEINFVTYDIRRSYAFEVTGRQEDGFTVSVTYNREKKTDGTNYINVRTFYETLFSTIDTYLGVDWQATVDYWRPPEEDLVITDTEIDQRPCWTATVNYIAVKTFNR